MKTMMFIQMDERIPKRICSRKEETDNRQYIRSSRENGEMSNGK